MKMRGREYLSTNVIDTVTINDKPFLVTNPTLSDVLTEVPITRRELFTLGYLASLTLLSPAAKIGFDTFMDHNPALKTLLTIRNVESISERSMVDFTEEEARNLWAVLLGDSIGRGQADDEMKNETDVYTPADFLTDRLGQIFSPTTIGRIQMSESGEFNQQTHSCSEPVVSDTYVEKLIYAFQTHKLGTFNLAHNSQPAEVIPCQIQTLQKSEIIEFTGARTFHESGGGNNPNRDFYNKHFNDVAKYIISHNLDITDIGSALDIFNEVDRTLEPVSSITYTNLKITKQFHDNGVIYGPTKQGIKAVYVYGNVRLGNAKGLVTPVELNKKDGYQVLKDPVDPRIRALANMYTFVLQNKKKEGINMFLEQYKDPGFTIAFIDLYNILGEGWIGNKRLFEYEHPTKLGYYVISLYLAYRMLINGQSLEQFQSEKLKI